MNILCFSITISMINDPSFHFPVLHTFEGRARAIGCHCLFITKKENKAKLLIIQERFIRELLIGIMDFG